MVIIMSDYYTGFVSSLIAKAPGFDKFANSCCPTFWENGKKCEEIYHIENIAFIVAIEIIEYGEPQFSSY